MTIRLLDPPLHEFLPSKSELLVERERLRRADDAERIAELEHLLARVRELEEVNPMLGTRGCRLAILYPEVYEMQVRAIVGAALAVRERDRQQPEVEIMIPLVELRAGAGADARARRTRGRATIEADADPMAVSVGTMVELPRACMIADLIATHADFFSFGTNDLTQTVLGLLARRRRGRVPEPSTSSRRSCERSPFETLDRAGRRQPRARCGGGRPRSPTRPSSSGSAASTAATPTASTSSTRSGSTT